MQLNDVGAEVQLVLEVLLECDKNLAPGKRNQPP